jgi:hypothetical protein
MKHVLQASPLGLYAAAQAFVRKGYHVYGSVRSQVSEAATLVRSSRRCYLM